MHITSCGLIYSHTYYHSKLLGSRESYKTEHIAITHDLDQFNADHDLSVGLHTSCIVNKGFLVDEHTTKTAYQPQKTLLAPYTPTIYLAICCEKPSQYIIPILVKLTSLSLELSTKSSDLPSP